MDSVRSWVSVLVLCWLVAAHLSSATMLVEGRWGRRGGGNSVLLTSSSSSSSPDRAVYIAFTIKSGKSYYVGILSSILGSKEASERALVYSYSDEFHAFAAKLTPGQASLLSKHPEILQVIPSKMRHLDGDSLKDPDLGN
ncbi:hypothetical protein Dimus_025445 [Dionaea muscipula]